MDNRINYDVVVVGDGPAGPTFARALHGRGLSIAVIERQQESVLADPLGATGIAIIYAVSIHSRGEAGDRQAEGACLGLIHVVGGGSVCW